MEVGNLKCTNCGAPISGLDKANTTFACPYCGSMLYVKGCAVSEANEPQTSEKLHVPFCCAAKELSDNTALKEVLSGMSAVLDKNSCSDTIIPIINDILKDKKEAATADSCPADYKKVENIIKDLMSAGESLIFYKTAAFFGFNKLKTGMFVTSERVGYIDGKRLFQVAYSDLDTMIIDIVYASTTYWYPNGNEEIFLSALAISNREFGAILAYIVLRAYESSNQQKSVILRMK